MLMAGQKRTEHSWQRVAQSGDEGSGWCRALRRWPDSGQGIAPAEETVNTLAALSPDLVATPAPSANLEPILMR